MRREGLSGARPLWLSYALGSLLAGCGEFAPLRDQEPLPAPARDTGAATRTGVRRPPRANATQLDSKRDAGALQAFDADAGSASAVRDAASDAAAPDAQVASGGVPEASVPDDPEPPTPECDGTINGQSCYRAASTALAWEAAQSDCALWGGALVRIDSANEDSFVAALLDQSVWIGARDGESDEGLDNVFAWTDGAAVRFGNWGLNQPDAAPGPDCVEKRQEPTEPWYDQPCENSRAYVCERALLARGLSARTGDD